LVGQCGSLTGLTARAFAWEIDSGDQVYTKTVIGIARAWPVLICFSAVRRQAVGAARRGNRYAGGQSRGRNHVASRGGCVGTYVEHAFQGLGAGIQRAAEAALEAGRRIGSWASRAGESDLEYIDITRR